MVESQEANVNLDTGAYCTCVGKNYLQTIIQDWEKKPIPIKGVRFSSASESKNTLEIIDLALAFPHPSQCRRVKVEFIAMESCTSNHFILGNDYLSVHGIDISSQKDRYFTIGANQRQKFGFLSNKKQINGIKNEEPIPETHQFIGEQPIEAELNEELTEKMKQRLINLLLEYKRAFSTDKEPLGAIIGNEVNIILNVEKPYPPLLRRPAY
ncbi:hypothetical protein O181_001319 [Austropuccinia psidii MF-1]|uniref:Retropepsins domain-containing protein n=1 Tax=Austropuccinia psidii MF-1 TaxID=1389203 RepID=A0A9Q3GBR2_9BASI|nr:hypothetical protein [Austropuccinia psidii MF-1]